MSEVEELEAEVEAPEVNPIEDLINTVASQDFSKAAPTFAEIMQDKISDALDQERIAVADQVFNGAEPEDEEISDEEAAELDDVTDEEIDDAIDEVEDEEETEEN
jgi:hypothetical protein